MCVTYIDFSRFSYLLVGGKVQLHILYIAAEEPQSWVFPKSEAAYEVSEKTAPHDLS